MNTEVLKKVISLPQDYELCKYCSKNPFNVGFNSCPYLLKFIDELKKRGYELKGYYIEASNYIARCSTKHQIELPDGEICIIKALFNKEETPFGKNCYASFEIKGKPKEIILKSIEELLSK